MKKQNIQLNTLGKGMLFLAAIAMGHMAHAQQKVNDGTVAATAINSNAIAEYQTLNKGILMPRIALTSTTAAAPLSAHVAGMHVYNTATAGTAPTNVTPGEYYNNGSQWVRIAVAISNTLTYGSGAPVGGCAAATLYTDTLSTSPTVGQQWTCSGGTWVTYTPPSQTEWYLGGTSNDATNNKVSTIWRNGRVLLPYTQGSWSDIFGFAKNLSTSGGILGGYIQMTPDEDFYIANQASGNRQTQFATSINVLPSGSNGYVYADALLAYSSHISQRGGSGSWSGIIGFGDYSLGTAADHAYTLSQSQAYMQMNPGNQLFFANNSGAGFAFSGDVNINGTLSKAAGTFKIDHPQDPANKYLIHSFVESPDMMNVYNGNITTDDRGYAVVNLPTYFESENKDFRYQLTTIGSFAKVTVWKKIDKNQFVIKADSSNVEVSWQVTGIRNDEYAKAHRIVDVVDKVGVEKGKYLHPIEFGKSEELGIYYNQVSPKEVKK